jgi:di/tricarboxylate transporter
MDTALTLTTDMELVLGLVVFTMVMFLFERIRADVVALVVLVVLGLTGLVPREDLFGGFSGSAVMSIIATMILGAGLDRTGALNRLASWLLRRAHGVESRLLLYTTAAAGFTSSIMQNPSVMSLFLPVASRLSSRTGLTLSRMLLPLAAAIVMGGALTMVGNSPLILLNDLLVAANANLPSGAASLEPLNMFAPMPIGIALLAASLAYFHFFGSKLLREDGGDAVTPARTQSYFARAYGIDGDVHELTVTVDSPLVGMSLGDAESLHGAPLFLALQTGNESRLSPPADARIWVGSVLGAMGPKQQVTDFAQNNFLRISSRLRAFGDLFNPSRAGISEAVVPPTSGFIGKTAGAAAPAQAARAQPAGDQPRQAGAARGRAQAPRSAPATCWSCTASGPTWRRRRRARTSWWSPTTRRTSSARTSSRSRWRSSRHRCCWRCPRRSRCRSR